MFTPPRAKSQADQSTQKEIKMAVKTPTVEVEPEVPVFAGDPTPDLGIHITTVDGEVLGHGYVDLEAARLAAAGTFEGMEVLIIEG